MTSVLPSVGAGPGDFLLWRVLRWMRAHPLVTFWATVLVALVALSVFAPLIAPYDPTEHDRSTRFVGPSVEHWLGTDGLGRDQLSRLVYGTKVTLLAATWCITISGLLGVPAGLAAGYRGGWFDTVASRINDFIMSVPGLVMALTVIAALGKGLITAMFAVGIILTPTLFRVSRAAALDVKQETYIEAAIAIGCRPSSVMWRHVLPNAASAIVIQITFLLGIAVVAESGLSFLGLGVQPPDSSFGTMLGAARNRPDLSYLLYGPGVALCIVVMAFMLLGDGLRDALSISRNSERT